jgi:hypothetical protein
LDPSYVHAVGFYLHTTQVEQYVGHQINRMRALLAISALVCTMVGVIAFQYGKRNRVLLGEYDVEEGTEEVVPLYYSGKALAD